MTSGVCLVVPKENANADEHLRFKYLKRLMRIPESTVLTRAQGYTKWISRTHYGKKGPSPHNRSSVRWLPFLNLPRLCQNIRNDIIAEEDILHPERRTYQSDCDDDDDGVMKMKHITIAVKETTTIALTIKVDGKSRKTQAVEPIDYIQKEKMQNHYDTIINWDSK